MGPPVARAPDKSGKTRTAVPKHCCQPLWPIGKHEQQNRHAQVIPAPGGCSHEKDRSFYFLCWRRLHFKQVFVRLAPPSGTFPFAVNTRLWCFFPNPFTLGVFWHHSLWCTQTLLLSWYIKHLHCWFLGTWLWINLLIFGSWCLLNNSCFVSLWTSTGFAFFACHEPSAQQ